jgi:heme a synthase
MSESGIVEEGRVARDAAGAGAREPWVVSRVSRPERLAQGFGALLGLTVCLIVLGALVRAHAAGLACPDWPLCFGAVVPEINLQVAFEYSHRVLAASMSLLFAALAGLALHARQTPSEVRRLLALAMALLATQILFGALTVWHLLAAWTVTSHLIIGNSFAVTLLWIHCALRDAGGPRAPAAPVGIRERLALSATAAVLFAQLVLGGLVSSRFAGLACPEWPACKAGVWFPSWTGGVGLQLLHRLNGYLLLAALATTAALCWRAHPLRRLTVLALLLGALQLCVGVANVWLGIPVEVTGLHTGLATLLVLSVALALRSAWRTPLAGMTSREAVLHPR